MQLMCLYAVARVFEWILSNHNQKEPNPKHSLLQSSSYFTVSTIETKLTIIKTWKGAYHSEKIQTVSSLHLIHPFTRKGWEVKEVRKRRESEEGQIFITPGYSYQPPPQFDSDSSAALRLKQRMLCFFRESVLLTSSWSNILPGSWWSIRQCLFQIKLEEVWQSVAYGRGGAGYLFRSMLPRVLAAPDSLNAAFLTWETERTGRFEHECPDTHTLVRWLAGVAQIACNTAAPGCRWAAINYVPGPKGGRWGYLMFGATKRGTRNPNDCYY